MSTAAAEQVSTSSYTPRADAPSGTRIQSLDLIRGVVMILMAIDHVRVYSGIPAGGPSPGVFITRWVTHFCAPAFVFLAGTAAYFHGKKLGDTRALSKFLATRGALLVMLELTVIRFFWSFNADLTAFTLAGVIWMLGWCMIILAGLVRLEPRTVGWLGLGIILLQQLFGLPPRAVPAIASAWAFIYSSGADALGGVNVLYVLVPWIGVMAAGYGFGLVMERPREDRDRLLVRIGLAAIALYLIAGTAKALMSDDANVPFVFRLLNQQKYPASQLFLMMTLGPVIALIPLAERARGRAAQAATTIGRVPLFYYLAHIPLIHLSALAVNAIRTGATGQEWYSTAPYTQVPEQWRWPLWLLYSVFVADVGLLYLACRWYARVKADRPRAWMRYI